jgi:hypothetical protein
VLLAGTVAVLHATAVVFMLAGALLALRWPRLLWAHVPVAVTILGLYLSGSDCPLTTWELALRRSSGEPGYSGGFIGHYVTEPLGFPIHATATQVGIYVVAFLPNVVGYGLLARRRLRTTSARRPTAAPPDPSATASPRSPQRPPRQPPSVRGR